MAKFAILSITQLPHVKVDGLWLKQHCDGAIIEYRASRTIWPCIKPVDLNMAAAMNKTMVTPWFFIVAYVGQTKCRFVICDGDDCIINIDIGTYIQHNNFNIGCLCGDIANAKEAMKNV